MANIYQPQQLDAQGAALSLVANLVEAMKNPTAIKDMADHVVEAQTLSESRRKEAQIAEDTIAQSKAAQAKLKQEQDVFEKYKTDKIAELDGLKKIHESNVEALVNERKSFQVEIDKARKEADDRMSIAMQSHADANARAIDLQNQIKALQEDQLRNQIDAKRIDARNEALKDAERKLAIRKAALEEVFKD